MSISSLGGPLKREYLTLPRTKTMDAISFATGGYIPELMDASDEELQAMVTRGELDANVATKIIMERASRDSRSASTEAPLGQTISNAIPQAIKDWWGTPRQAPPPRPPMPNMAGAGNPAAAAPSPSPPPVPTGPAFSAPAATGPVGQAPMELNPPQVIQPTFRESLGNAIGMPRKGGEQRFRPMPSDADRYSGAAPPPQHRNDVSPITETERVNSNKAVDDFLWDTDKYATKEDAARAKRQATGDRMGMAPYREGASAALGLEGANANVPPPFDLNKIPAPEYPIAPPAGISALPAPPAGAASADVGGIVQPEYPLPLDPALKAGSPLPTQDPMAPEAYPKSPDPMTTGGAGGGINPAYVEDSVRRMAETPLGKDVIQSTDGLFGNGRGWEALMMLGLGMAASKNPSALGALAEGGLGAMKYMGERRKEDRDERRLAQQDRRLDNAEERANRSYNLQVDQFDYSKKKDKERLELDKGKAATEAERAAQLGKYYDSMIKKNEMEMKQLEQGGGSTAEIKNREHMMRLLKLAKEGDEGARAYIMQENRQEYGRRLDNMYKEIDRLNNDFSHRELGPDGKPITDKTLRRAAIERRLMEQTKKSLPYGRLGIDDDWSIPQASTNPQKGSTIPQPLPSIVGRADSIVGYGR